ncbi:MAG: ABC transporter permease, partial [Cryobacterium sp.]|nr:ABC transporter permease [Cryobacterium sp.]
MNAIDIIRTAVGNSLRSKLRTTLTVVAIFIGAFTLTITSAIGTGVSSFIETQVASVGAPDVLSITKTAMDAPAATEGPAPYDPDKAIVAAAFTGDGSQLSTGILTAEDLVTIKRVDGILDVSAAQQVNPRYVEYGENGKFELVVNSNSSLTDPELAAGTQLEAATEEMQILLDTSYIDTLGFADAEAAVGETVTIGVADYAGTMHEVAATVAGVQIESILAAGAALNQPLADELYRVQNIGVPVNSIEGSIMATAHFDPAASDEQIDAIKVDLADQGYTAVTVADQIGMIQTVISGIIGILNAFAIIALIAAGFGIINTLLMSVQERTREIGLMKAMG